MTARNTVASPAAALPWLVFAGFLSCLLWLGVCQNEIANKTFEQRIRLIHAAYSEPAVEESWMTELDEVSFWSHHWAVVTFRDPYELYSPALSRAAKAGAQPWWKSDAGKARFDAWKSLKASAPGGSSRAADAAKASTP